MNIGYQWKLCLCLSAIGRTLIPRYFRSIFEGGATELYYVLKHPKESFHNNFVSLDCDQCTMVTQNGKPMFTQVGIKTEKRVCVYTYMHAFYSNIVQQLITGQEQLSSIRYRYHYCQIVSIIKSWQYHSHLAEFFFYAYFLLCL